MMFANSDQEITLIYNSDEQIGRKILAYAQTQNIPIREIDLKHIKITPTQWAQLADKMKIQIGDLVNTEHPNFSQKFGLGGEYSDEDWLKLLVNNPDILKGPIVMKGDRVVMMTNPQEMLYFME